MLHFTAPPRTASQLAPRTASQRPSSLQQRHQLALVVQGDHAGAVVAAPHTLATDEHVGHAGAVRQLVQVRQQGESCVSRDPSGALAGGGPPIHLEPDGAVTCAVTDTASAAFLDLLACLLACFLACCTT